MASPLRRLLVVSSPGLERCLERELQGLRIPGHLEQVPGGVLLTATADSLWRAVLQSRVAESVRVQVGDPFHAPDVGALGRRLRALPWEQCLQLGAPDWEPPAVKATSSRSRLYHTGLLEEATASAIADRRASLVGDAGSGASSTAATAGAGGGLIASPGAPSGGGGELQQATDADGGSVGAAEASRAAARGWTYGAPPDVRVQLRCDECQVSVGASGLLHQSGYRKAVGDAPLRETLAAACVLSSPLLKRLTIAANNGEDLVLWDPFCGSGVLLLEALGIVLGLLPGSPSKRYPFASFPDHSAIAYERVAAALAQAPHPAAGRLRLLGTDTSQEQVERARRNLRRLLRRMGGSGPRAGAGDADADAPDLADEAPRDAEERRSLPCTVDFELGPPSRVVQRLSGRPTMVLTNVPYGVLSGARRDGKSGRFEALEAYSQLGRMLRQQKAEWRGVFCIVANPDEFRQHTDGSWSSVLRFLNGGRWVELLEWTGNRPAGSSSTASSSSRRGGAAGGGGAGGARGEARGRRRPRQQGDA